MRKSYSLKYQNKNESFFSCIDTEEKAYFLGLFVADGNISKSQHMVSWTLKRSDSYVLDILSQLILSAKAVKHYKRPNPLREDKSVLSISSKKIKSSLIDLGLAPNKSFSARCPIFTLDINLRWHFLRGLWDGDGSIFRCKNGRNGASLIGSISTIDTVSLFLSGFGIAHKIYGVKTSQPMKRIEIHSNKDFLNFGESLYAKSSVFLRRKKDKYLDCRKDILAKPKKSSEIRGVTFNKHSKRWWARVTVSDKRRKLLGVFNSEAEAAKAITSYKTCRENPVESLAT